VYVKYSWTKGRIFTIAPAFGPPGDNSHFRDDPRAAFNSSAIHFVTVFENEDYDSEDTTFIEAETVDCDVLRPIPAVDARGMVVLSMLIAISSNRVMA